MYFKFYYYDGTGSDGPTLREASDELSYPGSNHAELTAFLENAFRSIVSQYPQQLLVMSTSGIGCIAVEEIPLGSPRRLAVVYKDLMHQVEAKIQKLTQN